MSAKLKSGRDRLVFVVDDDDLLRKVVVRYLVSEGYAVRDFDRASPALAAIKDQGERPEVLISDYRMPGMNGLELIFECRKAFPQLRTMSISGTPVIPELEIPQYRPDRLLSKPFLPSELLGTLSSLLEERC